MDWLYFWLAMVLVSQIWLAVRLWRSSAPRALVSLLFGFLAAIPTLFTQWRHKETRVTLPFLLNLASVVLALATAVELGAELEASRFSVAPARPATPTAHGASAASTAVAVLAAPAPAPQLQPTAEAASSASTQQLDQVDSLSAALQAAGIKHVLTRVPATLPLPEGVADAALISVPRIASGAASAAAGKDLSLTLFRCVSAEACRNLAREYMQQSEPEPRRVLQNGLLLLLVPNASAAGDDGDFTAATVASVFRRL